MKNEIRLLDMTLGPSEKNNQMLQAYISSSPVISNMVEDHLLSSTTILALDGQISSMSADTSSIKDLIISSWPTYEHLDLSLVVNNYLNTAGNFVSDKNFHNFRTDYLELSSHAFWKWRISTQYTTPVTYGLFNADKQMLAYGPRAPGNDIVVLCGELSTDQIMSQYPTAKYVIFSQKSGGIMDIQTPAENDISVNFVEKAIIASEEAIERTEFEAPISAEFTDFAVTIVPNYYVSRQDLKIASSNGYQRTEAIALKAGRTYRVSTQIGTGGVARYALLRQDGQIIWTLDHDNNTTSMVDYDIDCDAIAVDLPMATHFIASSQKGAQYMSIKKADKPNAISLKDVVEEIQEDYSSEWIEVDVELSDGFLNYSGKRIEHGSTLGKYTNAIEIDATMKFRHSGASLGNVCTYAVFDGDGNWITDGGYDESRRTKELKFIDNIVDCSRFFDAGLPAKYIRFGTYGNATYKPYVSKLQTGKTSLSQKLHETASSGNVLAGKLWLACGDSFTSPGGSDMFDPRTIAAKSYPYFIQQRNEGLSALQPGGSGEAMSHDPFNPEANNRLHFCDKVNTLSDSISAADYITFMYGLNDQKNPKPLSSYRDETPSKYLSSMISKNSEFELSSYFIGDAIGHPAQISDIMNYEALSSYVFRGTQYGTRDDSSIDTIWGAWNTVLSAVFTYNPTIKAGIIITDGGIEDQQYETQLSIASWWGIPVLDLDRDPKVPLMIRGKTGRDINPFAQRLRQLAFATSMSNFHPTEVGHEFRSTIIENFLRSL